MAEAREDPPFTVPPDPAALLAALSDMLRGDDLAIIAEADHGWNVGEHLAGLIPIADGIVARPLPWHPRDVLERVRWDEPSPEPAEERRLWRHAFACCALLRAYGDHENHGGMLPQESTLVGLATTLHKLAALPLPREKRRALAAMDGQAAALLAWVTPRVAGLGELPVFGLALLWFALAAGVPRPALAALVDMVMRAEATAEAEWWEFYGWAGVDRIRLFDTPEGSLRIEAWRALGVLFPGRLRPEHGPAVAEGVRRVAGLLAPPNCVPGGERGRE